MQDEESIRLCQKKTLITGLRIINRNAQLLIQGLPIPWKWKALKKIWARSVEDLKLRFTTFIGDGDSKAFDQLVANNPYGEDVTLVKHECVGHVQKRLGTALRNLKKKGALDDSGMLVKFRGKLTNGSIKKLNVYYGGAIRNSSGSVDIMVKAIDASFFAFDVY